MEELAKDYWSLANGITAFAVAQSLAFAYALTKDGSARIHAKEEAVTWAIVLAAGAFCVAVWFCNHAHIALLTEAAAAPDGKPLSGGIRCTLTGTMLGRMGAIIVY